MDHIELVLYVQYTLNMSRNPVIAIGGSYSKPLISWPPSCMHDSPQLATAPIANAVLLHPVQVATPGAQIFGYGKTHGPGTFTPPTKLFEDSIVKPGQQPHVCHAGGQLASYLRMRYPDVIAGAIASSSTSLGAPGLGLVKPCTCIACSFITSTMCCCIHSKSLHGDAGIVSPMPVDFHLLRVMGDVCHRSAKFSRSAARSQNTLQTVATAQCSFPC